jgi:hypothetical protein
MKEMQTMQYIVVFTKSMITGFLKFRFISISLPYLCLHICSSHSVPFPRFFTTFDFPLKNCKWTRLGLFALSVRTEEVHENGIKPECLCLAHRFLDIRNG